MLISQVTTVNLRRVFQVDPATVWLQDDVDDTAYFPSEEGTFSNLQSSQGFYVEGPAISRSSGIPGCSSVSLTSTPPPPLPPSQFKSVVPVAKRSSPMNGNFVRVKVIKADMQWNGKTNKPVFTPSHQTYVEVQESTANVDYIKNNIRRQWGDNYILVTNDGLELEDSSATQGLAFWKAPRRVIYAVSSKSRKKSNYKSKAPAIVIDSSDDDNDFIEHPKRKRVQFGTKIDALADKITDLKAKVADIISITKEVKIPLPLINMMRDTFKCTICHKVQAKPPLIISKCCKIIIGCDACVNKWYSGTDALVKSCPACRYERGYNETMLLKGLDDFLAKTDQLINYHDDVQSPLFSNDDDDDD